MKSKLKDLKLRRPALYEILRFVREICVVLFGVLAIDGVFTVVSSYRDFASSDPTLDFNPEYFAFAAGLYAGFVLYDLAVTVVDLRIVEKKERDNTNEV